MDGRGLVLLRGLSRLYIYPPSGAHIRMVHASERSESTPYRDAALFSTRSLTIEFIMHLFFADILYGVQVAIAAPSIMVCKRNNCLRAVLACAF